MEYKIDKNVPIPSRNLNNKLNKIFGNMEVGDSIIYFEEYNYEERVKIMANLIAWAKRNKFNWKFASRKTDENDPAGANKLRIWRIK